MAKRKRKTYADRITPEQFFIHGNFRVRPSVHWKVVRRNDASVVAEYVELRDAIAEAKARAQHERRASGCTACGRGSTTDQNTKGKNDAHQSC